DDPETEAVVLIGEIGGSAEEQAAEFIQKEFNKPVAAYIAGRLAPPGKRMGHAGAIISGGSGTAQGKIKALTDAGVRVVENLTEMGAAMKEMIR
ncbi:MAG: succinate--CoA ligase subunit alpha, partial [Deltaproteobacteria bacterium]|nr:succinate--CoA ligase subunit alpha [Deltaproteobacteria bacterium]